VRCPHRRQLASRNGQVDPVFLQRGTDWHR